MAKFMTEAMAKGVAKLWPRLWQRLCQRLWHGKNNGKGYGIVAKSWECQHPQTLLPTPIAKDQWNPDCKKGVSTSPCAIYCTGLQCKKTKQNLEIWPFLKSGSACELRKSGPKLILLPVFDSFFDARIKFRIFFFLQASPNIRPPPRPDACLLLPPLPPWGPPEVCEGCIDSRSSFLYQYSGYYTGVPAQEEGEGRHLWCRSERARPSWGHGSTQRNIWCPFYQFANIYTMFEILAH